MFNTFSDYLTITCEQRRAQNLDPINDPFEYQPVNPKPTRGILLIHGLLDSPFKMRELGQFYASLGFLVRAILLPGHGTHPEDLVKVHYQEWIALTEFGCKTLEQDVAEVHACGFSTGAMLILHQYLHHKNLKSLTLIAPPIKIHGVNPFTMILFKSLTWLKRKPIWVYVAPENDKAYYTSIPFNAVKQVVDLSKKTLKKLGSARITTPLFVIASADDHTVQFQPILHFFLNHASQQSQFLYFAKHPIATQDARLIFESSAIPEEHILDFSHPCLPVSPENKHYGRHGDYQSPMLSPKNYVENIIYLGETHLENTKRYHIRRLLYNPKFSVMVGYLRGFVEKF